MIAARTLVAIGFFLLVQPAIAWGQGADHAVYEFAQKQAIPTTLSIDIIDDHFEVSTRTRFTPKFSTFLGDNGEDIKLPGDIERLDYRLRWDAIVWQYWYFSLETGFTATGQNFRGIRKTLNEGIGDTKVTISYSNFVRYEEPFSHDYPEGLQLSLTVPGSYDGDLLGAPGDEAISLQLGWAVSFQPVSAVAYSIFTGYRLRSDGLDDQFVLRADVRFKISEENTQLVGLSPFRGLEAFGRGSWHDTVDGTTVKSTAAVMSLRDFRTLDSDALVLAAGFRLGVPGKIWIEFAYSDVVSGHNVAQARQIEFSFGSNF